MDEYQFGVPEKSYEEHKVFDVDVSMFPLGSDDKKEAKAAKDAAKDKIKKVVARFQRRQRKNDGKIWSEPFIDVKAGTAEIIYCKVGQYCVEGFEAAGKYFKMDCPITGNYMWGDNWFDTH
jgi:hypothetical protein